MSPSNFVAGLRFRRWLAPRYASSTRMTCLPAKLTTTECRGWRVCNDLDPSPPRAQISIASLSSPVLTRQNHDKMPGDSLWDEVAAKPTSAWALRKRPRWVACAQRAPSRGARLTSCGSFRGDLSRFVLSELVHTLGFRGFWGRLFYFWADFDHVAITFDHVWPWNL